MNQYGFTGRFLRSFFESGDDGFGAGQMVCMSKMQDNIEFGDNIREIGRVEICDDDFNAKCFLEFFGAGRIADKSGDILFVQFENVVEDLAAEKSSCSYQKHRKRGREPVRRTLMDMVVKCVSCDVAIEAA